jgi:hypothetical protein
MPSSSPPLAEPAKRAPELVMRILLFSVVSLFIFALCGAAQAEIAYRGGDGSDMAHAVVIVGAPNEFVGVAAENAWVTRRHRGWRKDAQALLSNNGRWYDVISYKTEKGSRDVWFDITDFYGKNGLSH